MSNTSSKVRETALTAVLAAIILLMAFTPLGYLLSLIHISEPTRR